MSPARTAVLWNVLVSDVGKIVNTIDIVPNPVVRKRDTLKFALENWINWGIVLLSASLIWGDLG